MALYPMRPLQGRESSWASACPLCLPAGHPGGAQLLRAALRRCPSVKRPLGKGRGLLLRYLVKQKIILKPDQEAKYG